MENASKALLMAASVLIGVVILSLAAYLFAYFGSSVKEMNDQMKEEQLELFNNQFTSYEDKKKELTIYDVITVTNLAIENNRYYELSLASNNNFYIEVKLNGLPLQSKTQNELSNLLNSESLVDSIDSITGETVKKLKRYQCKVYFNSNTGRVNLVEFSNI